MHKFQLNSILTLRKEHPCGSKEWKVVRYGSDVKIQCLGCDRIVMIDRPTLMKRIKKVSNPED
jgi:hypothetical protein